MDFHGTILAMIIYLVRCLITGKGYVGQTTCSLEKRWRGHKSTVALGKSRTALHRALRKYGADAFRISVLCHCTSLEELNRKEREYIVLLGTRAPGGYNMTTGGKGTCGIKHSEETCKKFSELRRGNKNALGFKHSDQTRKKMSEGKLGNKNKLGKKESKETRERKRIAHIGKSSGMLGKHWSEESKKKLSLTCFHHTIAWG